MEEPTQHPLPDFTWRAYPARERKGRAALGAGVILAVAIAVFIMVRADGGGLSVCLAWAGMSALILFLTLNRFYLPSRFTLDAEGITANSPLRQQRLLWADIRRFVHDAHGGFLSTRARRSMLDTWSGLHILFGRSRREVIERIRIQTETLEV